MVPDCIDDLLLSEAVKLLIKRPSVIKKECTETTDIERKGLN